MNEIKRVVGINLIVILFINVLIRITSNYEHRDRSWAIMGGVASLILLQLVVNLILGVVFALMNKGKLAKPFFISIGVVLVIGFSTCWANASF